MKEFVKRDKNIDPPFSLKDLYPPIGDPDNPGDSYRNRSMRKEMKL